MPAPAKNNPEELTLALFVPWLAADDADSAIATNDLAVTAHLLYGSSNFHRSFSKNGSRRANKLGSALAHNAAATVAFQVGLLHH